MAELDDLKTYKLQLQQVEAALTTDPDNEELLKLQTDLQEVINLTTELITAPATASGQGNGSDLGSSAAAVDSDHEDESTAWKVGDKCLAFYEEDSQHYEAVIEEVLEDGTCTVTFTGYNNSAICPISQLKTIDLNLKRGGAKGQGVIDAKKSKKDLIAEQREYKRKKAQKKAQRMKQLDEEHETEKNKWLDFNVKTFSKTSKGKVKKSIFATPDAGGKVGVGTCGSGGRPMTSYQHQEKWKK